MKKIRYFRNGYVTETKDVIADKLIKKKRAELVKADKPAPAKKADK